MRAQSAVEAGAVGTGTWAPELNRDPADAPPECLSDYLNNIAMLPLHGEASLYDRGSPILGVAHSGQACCFLPPSPKTSGLWGGPSGVVGATVCPRRVLQWSVPELQLRFGSRSSPKPLLFPSRLQCTELPSRRSSWTGAARGPSLGPSAPRLLPTGAQWRGRHR